MRAGFLVVGGAAVVRAFGDPAAGRGGGGAAAGGAVDGPAAGRLGTALGGAALPPAHGRVRIFDRPYAKRSSKESAPMCGTARWRAGWAVAETAAANCPANGC